MLRRWEVFDPVTGITLCRVPCEYFAALLCGTLFPFADYARITT